MSALVEEWVKKADADFATAQREIAVTKTPNYDAVCFHAQQCCEKLMKALLLSVGVTPPRTHDLAYLATLLQTNGIALELGSASIALSDRRSRFLSLSRRICEQG